MAGEEHPSQPCGARTVLLMLQPLAFFLCMLGLTWAWSPLLRDYPFVGHVGSPPLGPAVSYPPLFALLELLGPVTEPLILLQL